MKNPSKYDADFIKPNRSSWKRKHERNKTFMQKVWFLILENIVRIFNKVVTLSIGMRRISDSK